MKKIGLTLAAIALALTAACGGNSRPSQDQLEKALKGKDSVVGTVPAKIAPCVSKVLRDSKLSDDTLQAIVDKDKDYKGSSKDEKVLKNLTPTLTKECT